MKNLMILVTLAFSLVSCSELLFWKKDEVNVYQTIRVTEGEESIECEITGKQPNKVNPELTYYWIKNRVVHVTSGDFGGHLLHGAYQHYYKDGSLKEKGEFRNGLKEGSWKLWGTDQFLASEYTFSKGQKSGPFKEFKEGNLVKSGNYQAGEFNGKLILHTDPDIAALVYKKGVVTDTVFQSTQ